MKASGAHGVVTVVCDSICSRCNGFFLFLCREQFGSRVTHMAETVRVSIEGIEDPDAHRAATERARDAAVLELYRLGRITSGQAARELGTTRVEFLDLAGRRGIPTIQTSADELEEELASLEP
jgi:hypothetical protein